MTIRSCGDRYSETEREDAWERISSLRYLGLAQMVCATLACALRAAGAVYAVVERSLVSEVSSDAGAAQARSS
jgi:hypothetical protein